MNAHLYSCPTCGVSYVTQASQPESHDCLFCGQLLTFSAVPTDGWKNEASLREKTDPYG